MNIVAVTGCFDIITIAHIRLIKFAREYGKVIIGINSDKSIKQLKGVNRPINNEINRKEILESIKGVCKVFIVDNINMVEFLKLHKANYWAKGGDYNIDTINQNERKAVEEYGGKIIFFFYIDGYSTTNTLKRLHD